VIRKYIQDQEKDRRVDQLKLL